MEEQLKHQTEIVLDTLSTKLNITLTQLCFYYSVDDTFKEGVDEYLNKVNSIRIKRGSQKINMNDYLKSLVEQN